MGSLGHSTCGIFRWWLTRLRLLCILDAQFHCAECAMLSAVRSDTGNFNNAMENDTFLQMIFLKPFSMG